MLLLEFQSTLSVPDEMDAFTLVAEGTSSGQVLEREFALAEPFPHSFALQAGVDSNEFVDIRVTATLEGASVAQQRAGAGFLAGSTRTVLITLDPACRSVQCARGQECVAGVCQLAVDGGLPPDAGRTDSGSGDVDAGAPPDGGFEVPVGPGAPEPGCGGAAEAAASFLLDLDAERDVFVTTHGAALDTVVAVRSGRCGAAEVACSDDADGRPTSALQARLEPGRYLILVYSKAPATELIPVDINVSPPAPPGDQCGHPQPLPEGGVLMGNSCGFGSELNGSCAGTPDDSLAGPDQVFYFVVEGPAREVTFDGCNAGCTDYDATLEVRRFCNEAASTTRVACESDGCRSRCVSFVPRTNRQPVISAGLTPGLYYLVVDGQGPDGCGDYVIEASGL